MAKILKQAAEVRKAQVENRRILNKNYRGIVEVPSFNQKTMQKGYWRKHAEQMMPDSLY